MTAIGLMLLCLVLPACGYHLRGGVEIPEGISAVYIKTPNKSLQMTWREELSIVGVPTTPTAEEADAILTIDNETFNRRVLSVDAGTGKVTEYELAYAVRFSMSRPDASELLAPQTVTRIRSYIFNPDTVLGNESEQQLLHREMREDALRQILGRLSAAAAAQGSK